MTGGCRAAASALPQRRRHVDARRLQGRDEPEDRGGEEGEDGREKEHRSIEPDLPDVRRALRRCRDERVDAPAPHEDAECSADS